MDQLFNMQKIKFSTLDKLFEAYNEHIYSDTTVHVFVNVESILRKLTATRFDEYIKTNPNNEKEFVAHIFNIAAHYRLYFNKSKINSKIYLYMGHPFETKYRNEEFIPEYRKPFATKMTRDQSGKYLGNMVNNTVQVLQTLFNYIEGVYFITSGFLEPSMIPKIISTSFGEKDYGLIVTTDRYEYQYAAMGMDVIRNKGNDSYYINRHNVVEILKRESKIVSPETAPSIYTSFILSFLDDKMRNIKGIDRVGVGTVIKSINKGIREGIISTTSFNFNTVLPIIHPDIIDPLRLNFLAVDVESQYQLATKTMLAPIHDQIVDLFDEHSLRKINENYFLDNPMMIMEIQPYHNKPKKNIFGQ